jgi:nucleotide-binding universal stress UspA family protein
MSPYEFTNVLVALDGSPGAAEALDCALSICSAVRAPLTALAVEGKLPAYAASLGEVDEVRREKDQYFSSVFANPGPPTATRQIRAPSRSERSD